MQNQASLQETKQHGAVRFPFNLYPCTIPGDFPQVALHWQESMELVFVKRGTGLVQVGAESCPARMGDIFIFTPGTLHALRQAEGQCMEYENIIFELELLGGAEDLCAEKYLLPLQKRALACAADPERFVLSAGRRGGRWRMPNAPSYLQAAACLREVEGCQPRQARAAGQGVSVSAALLLARQRLAAETADTQRLKTLLQWLGPLYRGTRVADAAGGLLLQCQPLHAVVPADDRAELLWVF